VEDMVQLIWSLETDHFNNNSIVVSVGESKLTKTLNAEFCE